MKAESVREILALYDEGTVTRPEMLAMLLMLVTLENVEDLIANLPAQIRDDFVAWVRQCYGVDSRSDEAIYIGGEGYDPPPEEAIMAIRMWLARNPVKL
jgi:hypothetical protein